MTTLGIDPIVFELLRCPQPHHARLRVDAAASTLVCVECGAAYPVRDGLPILLIDEAQDPA